MHGGKVDVKSESGKGTEVRVWLSTQRGPYDQAKAGRGGKKFFNKKHEAARAGIKAKSRKTALFYLRVFGQTTRFGWGDFRGRSRYTDYGKSAGTYNVSAGVLSMFEEDVKAPDSLPIKLQLGENGNGDRDERRDELFALQKRLRRQGKLKI